MLDGSDNMHVIKRCKGIDMARSDSTFEGVDCTEVEYPSASHLMIGNN